MHPATPPHIRSLYTSLCLAEFAYNSAKETHGIFSAPSNKALVAFDAAQDAFDDAYNEFLVTAKNAEAASENIYATDKELIKHLQADADGSTETVKALRAESLVLSDEADALKSEVSSLKIELKDADTRLQEIAEILRNCERSGIEAFHDSLTAALYRNSI